MSDYPAGTTPEERYNSKGMTTGRTATPNSPTSRTWGHDFIGSEAPTKGAATGGIIGGVLALLAGTGALAIPGVGPFIAAGPLMATLAGIGGGGTLGGIIGALVGAGIPEHEAKRYENRLNTGGILISVRTNTDNLAKQAKDVLQKSGAEDVAISVLATTATTKKSGKS